jgi:hypothetical protein
MFCWPCIIVYQYSETNVMNVLLKLLRIKGIYMFWAWATDYGLDGRGEIFRTRPDRPWGPPSLLYNDYRASPGGKAAEALCWQPTPF